MQFFHIDRHAPQIFCALMITLVTALALFFGCCQSAFAFTTEKCTARTNSDTTNEVLGATETRITWEGQAAKNENVTSVELTFPKGASFSIEDAKLTVLSGADLMNRSNPAVTFSQDGNTVVATLAEPLEAGAYLRIEVYEVKFPAKGGKEAFTGCVTLSDGSREMLNDIPSVDVSGVTLPEQLSIYLSEQAWVQQWNSNKFLHLFFDPTILVTSFPQVVAGFGMALLIVLIAFPLAIPFGLILSFMRMSRFRILKGLANIYVNVVRGTPVFLQIYIAFFGLPLAFGQLPEIPLGVAVLAFNSAAYQCEIFRAGIQSISKGQFEASRSLGMNAAQTMFSVIIPQTVRRVIPTMTNEFILLYKDTSMLAAVGILEIVMYAKSIVASTGSITPYIVAAFFYLVVTIPLAKVVGLLENKLDMSRTGVPASKKGKGLFAKRAAKTADAGELALQDAAASAGGPVVGAAQTQSQSTASREGGR